MQKLRPLKRKLGVVDDAGHVEYVIVADRDNDPAPPSPIPITAAKKRPKS